MVNQKAKKKNALYQETQDTNTEFGLLIAN